MQFVKSICNNKQVLIVIAIFVIGIIGCFQAGTIGIGLDIQEDDYADLLTTNATFIATILTVAFSLSIFIVQHGA